MIDTKFKTQDSFRQLSEAERSMIERKKQALQVQVERGTVNLLRSLDCDDVKLSKATEVNVTFDGRFLNGNVKVVCSAFKEKPFEIDVTSTIKEDNLVSPTTEELLKLMPVASEKKPKTVESIVDIKSISVKREADIEIMEQEKENFVIAAEAQTVNLLRSLNYDSIKLYQTSEVKLQRNSEGTYNGQVNMFVKLTDKNGTKKVRIPVLFSNSSFNPPPINILEKEIAKTSTDSEITEQELDEEVERKHEEIDEEEAKKEEETLKSMDIGPQAKKEEGVAKKAGATLPCIELSKTLRVNKSVLPDSLKVGDTIEVDGVRYLVQNDSDGKISEAGTGSVWLLQMVYIDEEGKPVVQLGS